MFIPYPSYKRVSFTLPPEGVYPSSFTWPVPMAGNAAERASFPDLGRMAYRLSRFWTSKVPEASIFFTPPSTSSSPALLPPSLLQRGPSFLENTAEDDFYDLLNITSPWGREVCCDREFVEQMGPFPLICSWLARGLSTHEVLEEMRTFRNEWTTEDTRNVEDEPYPLLPSLFLLNSLMQILKGNEDAIKLVHETLEDLLAPDKADCKNHVLIYFIAQQMQTIWPTLPAEIRDRLYENPRAVRLIFAIEDDWPIREDIIWFTEKKRIAPYAHLINPAQGNEVEYPLAYSSRNIPLNFNVGEDSQNFSVAEYQRKLDQLSQLLSARNHSIDTAYADFTEISHRMERRKNSLKSQLRLQYVHALLREFGRHCEGKRTVAAYQDLLAIYHLSPMQNPAERAAILKCTSLADRASGAPFQLDLVNNDDLLVTVTVGLSLLIPCSSALIGYVRQSVSKLNNPPLTLRLILGFLHTRPQDSVLQKWVRDLLPDEATHKQRDRLLYSPETITTFDTYGQVHTNLLIRYSLDYVFRPSASIENVDALLNCYNNSRPTELPPLVAFLEKYPNFLTAHKLPS